MPCNLLCLVLGNKQRMCVAQNKSFLLQQCTDAEKIHSKLKIIYQSVPSQAKNGQAKCDSDMRSLEQLVRMNLIKILLRPPDGNRTSAQQ